MKNILLILVLLTSAISVSAHKGGHGTHLKKWKIESTQQLLEADFIKYENNKVWLSNTAHKVVSFNLKDFSKTDQAYILRRNETIEVLNTKNQQVEESRLLLDNKLWLSLAGGTLLLFSIVLFTKQRKRIYLVAGSSAVVFLILISCSKGDEVEGDTDTVVNTEVPANDISFLEDIFQSFEGVTTSTDDTYFYVSSNGLPEHDMMVGITNWQQQVPISQPYMGDNSWAIPLQPVLAETPLSTQTNLLKGAIAIAANGIPIFNPLNNRGEDANVIGELDQWGGHCGRGDDYHYHIPPAHLQNTVGEGKPIAYAVDGFPVFGETTDELDEYLGKLNEDGSYQYHTVTEYPYFMAAVRGEVILDPTTTAPENQVIPQAFTEGVRPALDPLTGAEITDFELVAENSYSLSYVVNGGTYKVNYNWDETGFFTYEFIDPSGATTVETYQR